MRRSHTIRVSIERPFAEVYAYLSQPSNYGEWAAMEPGTLRQRADGDWEGTTLFGFRHIRFTPPNPFGVLDHTIFVPGGEMLTNPMRAVAVGGATEVSFTFIQREGMSEAQFESAIEWITTDFLALKSLLEVRGR